MRFIPLFVNAILFNLMLQITGIFANNFNCECNGHADTCDQETGACGCLHNTAGHNCERCAYGYYGNALEGTEWDCRQCNCPFNGPCVENYGSVVCTDCPEGQTGPLCERCENNYYGNPMDNGRESQPCKKCECNGNIYPDMDGNCDQVTGECLRCIYNTEGFNCEKCKKAYYGDAITLRQPGKPPFCQPCQCNLLGTKREAGTFGPICDNYSGQCSCLPHVVGRNCDKCADGYFKIASGEGCEPCNCDLLGSPSSVCHQYTGQCNCLPGFTGRKCNNQ